MELKEEVARQGILLELITECAGISNTGSMLRTLASRLRWVSTYDHLSVVLSDGERPQYWTMSAADDVLQRISLDELVSTHASVLTVISTTATPFADGSAMQVVGFPLEVRSTVYGAICMSRASPGFSHLELKLMQHVMTAVSAVLARIDQSEKERGAQRVLEVAESRLRQATRVAALFLWDVDVQQGTRRYDANVATLLGYDSPRQLDETAFSAAVHPADREAERNAFLLALREPHRVHGWSFRLTGTDGAERFVLSSGQAFLNDDGTLFEFVGVLSDITEMSRLRVLAEDRALFAEQMVGIVSHDLRNPLSTIVTAAAVLRRGGDLPPLKAKLLDSVDRSAHRARELIAELLDFTMARVGQGLPVARKDLDFHQLIERSVEDLGLSFPGRLLEHVSSGPGSARIDPERIAQLLGNLVSNAMSYGLADKPVTVTSAVSKDGATLAVHNHGDPIPPAMMKSMFEPMVRGAPERPTVRSVGLGLFIVRAIVTAHLGRVTVTSTHEDGTTFVCHFPAVDG